MATHLLVANPTAQSGKNAARIALAQDHFAKLGVTVELLSTLPAGGTIGAVEKALARGEHGVVVAMGGDGTFREVACGLLQSGRAREVAMGMLPTGTANDQGRSFGLEAAQDQLARNVSVVAEGHETGLDAGRITARDDDGHELASTWFFDSAGWGLSARVLASRNRDRSIVEKVAGLRELYRDKLVYAGAFLREFLDSYTLDDKFDAHVVADGETHELEGLSDLILKGTRIYAGAWVFDRDARHDDGEFEVVPFHGKRDWTSKAIVDLEGNPVTEEMLNAVGIAHSKNLSATDIAITLRRRKEGGAAIAAQLDGEEWIPSPRIEVKVQRKAIRLIVPATAAGE